MRARVAILALLCLGAPAFGAAAETWVEVRTANFTAVSNAGEGTARKAVREFEQVRAAYARLWPWARLAQGKPTVVLALRNEGTLKRWAPAYFEVKGGIRVVSGRAHGADRIYLLLRTDSRPDSMHITPAYNLYRAYLGLLLSSSFERRLPLWLSNGLAAVLANTFVHDDEIRVGLPVPWRFERFTRGPRLPLLRILDARSESPLLKQEDQREQFDAQCYVLVHYLLFGDQGAHAAALTRFQQLWLAGRSHDQAFAEAFGDPAALEQALPAHAARPILNYARFAAEAAAGGAEPSTRALSLAEVAGLQAAVHVAMDRPVEAQAAIREARTAAAGSPVSFDAEGLLADADNDKPRATAAYAKAVELGSTNAHSHYRAAQLAWTPEPDAAALAALRGRLERAIELNPFHANAHSFLADILVQQGDAAAALAPAERAITLEPGRPYHRLALARALEELDRFDEAKASAERGLQLSEDAAERADAERVVRRIVEEARYAQQRAALETSRKQTSACEGGDAAACALLLPDLERSCASNEVTACRYLGWLYSQGGGVPKDVAKAAGYGQRACTAGDKHACVEHAWAQARGEGVARDEASAMAALKALCDSGFLPACTRLALVHLAKPTAAGRARAKALLARACAGGDQDACSMARPMR